MTAFGTAIGQNLAASNSGHTGAEPVLVTTLAIARLKCAFHFLAFFSGGAKVEIIP